MNCYLRIWFSFLGSCLVLPVAAALPSPATPMTGSSTHASTGAQGTQPQVCLTDVFSGPLPGTTEYCQGVRDWNKGHYQDGMQFLKLAAGWGNKHAQYTLGLIHYGGHHVPTNVALGLAWLKLADERHNDAHIDLIRRSAFKSATLAQRRQAEDLYRKMRGHYGDEVAAARAWHHLQHWQLSHGQLDSGCVRVYGPEAAAAKRLGMAGVPPPSINPSLRSFMPADGNNYVSQNLAPPSHKGILKNRMLRDTARMSRMIARQQRAVSGSGEAGACITIQMQRQVTQQLSDQYFAGTVWGGIVTVEPLQQVPAPASSPSH